MIKKLLDKTILLSELKISTLIFAFLFTLFHVSLSHIYPKPYYLDDNLWTLEQEAWYYYKQLGINITHEIISTAYTHEKSGNPLAWYEGFKDDMCLLFLNSSDPYYTKYSGRLEAEGGLVTRVGEWSFVSDSSYSNSTYVISNVSGSYIEIEGVGAGFAVVYRICPSCGIINVYLNDSLYDQIDTYSSSTSRTCKVYYFSQDPVTFRARVEVSDSKNPSSTGYNVGIDFAHYGDTRFRVYLMDRLKFPDGKYVIMRQGSNTANYLISYHHFGSSGWPTLYKQTFYVLVRNPTSNTIYLNITNHDNLYDFATGTQQSTGSKPYCSVPIPSNSNWTLIKLDENSPYCARYTNSTHAGMIRTTYYTGAVSYTGWFALSYRLSSSAEGLEIDSFWVGYDRIFPQLIIKNAVTGEDLSNGGYISCDEMYSSGINITIINLPPSSTGWRVRLFTPSSYDYAHATLTGTAKSDGTLTFTNVKVSGRICKDYDYSNVFVVHLDNSNIPGTYGYLVGYQSSPIFVTPWNWAFPGLKVVNLDTGEEEYVLRPNQRYEVRVNFTDLNGAPIGSGVAIYFSFTHMYGTDGPKGGYENQILLDGTTPYTLWGDRTFTLYYDSNRKIWYRNFTTPSEWKYDGHLSYMRLRINNNTNTTFRLRYTTYYIQIPALTVMFSNHFYSGKGIDVVARDIDFGTSGNHPFYTTSGGYAPSFNDGVDDIYIEDAEKIILIYNSPEGYYSQVPITWYDKRTGFVHYTYGGYWAPGFSYLGSYKQNRRVLVDEFGLSRDYVALVLEEKNLLGYVYNATLYIPANGDYIEAFFDFPDIYSLDFIWQTFGLRVWGNFRGNNTKKVVESSFGTAYSNHFYPPFGVGGMTAYTEFALSNASLRPKNYYLGFTTYTPMPTFTGHTPCYPYCFEYVFSDYMKAYDYSNWKDVYKWKLVLGQLITDGLAEYREDSMTWSMFGWQNNQMRNYNMRKFRVKYFFKSNAFDDYEVLLSENYTIRYGYPYSIFGFSADVFFYRRSRMYSVGENVGINVKVRNGRLAYPGYQMLVYVFDESNNLLMQTPKTTNEDGVVQLTFTPSKTGVYRVKVTDSSGNTIGIGFFWVRKVAQMLQTDKNVYSPGELVTITDYVYDTASGVPIQADVFCEVYNQVNEKVWEDTLTRVEKYYQGSFIISPDASTGVWSIKCTANDGTSVDVSSANFAIAKATETERMIQSVELSAPDYVLVNKNFTVEVFVRNMKNELVNCDSVKFSLIRTVDNTSIYDDALMLLRETGKYYYIAIVDEENVYLARAKCVIDNIEYYSNPKVITSQRQLTEKDIWDYYNRTLTDYNQTEILEYLRYINATQMAYFPTWDALFFLWNSTYFVYWNGTIMRLDENWDRLWLYWNCSGENNTVCDYLRYINSSLTSVDVNYTRISEYVWNASEARSLIETVEKIWNVLQPTNQSVITGEKIISNSLSSTQSIVYQVNISVPEKEGYKVGDWVPIRISFWFVNNSECVTQGQSNLIYPVCEPLTAVFLGKIGHNLTQTITMRPINLEPGKIYTLVREIAIDPNERWIVYGREEIGSIFVIEKNDKKYIEMKPTYYFGQYTQASKEGKALPNIDAKLLVILGILIVITFILYKIFNKPPLYLLPFLLLPTVFAAEEIGTVSYIDDVPPTITILSPEEKTYDRTFIDLIYVVTDNVGVDKCWYELNEEINELPWCNNKTLNLPSGKYRLKLYANDTSGNEISAIVSFSISVGGSPEWIYSPINFSVYLNLTPPTQQLKVYREEKLLLNRTVNSGEIISLPSGTYTFVFSADGYKTKKVNVNVTRSLILTVSLEKESSEFTHLSPMSIFENLKNGLNLNKIINLIIFTLLALFIGLIVSDVINERKKSF